MSWEPECYTRGNYFQNEINEWFRREFRIKPFGNILDVGCGDGQYTHTLASQIKHGRILGIDSSAAMIRYANQHWATANLQFEVHAIETFCPSLAYDFVLSFWCLHWTNIALALTTIYRALKPGGRLYAVFSALSDNSMLQAWHELSKRSAYQTQQQKYQDPSNKQYLYQVINLLTRLPFRQVNIYSKITATQLPHLDYFLHLLKTMPFAQTYSEQTLLDLCATFQTICQKKHGGNLYYETRPIFIEAIR